MTSGRRESAPRASGGTSTIAAFGGKTKRTLPSARTASRRRSRASLVVPVERQIHLVQPVGDVVERKEVPAVEPAHRNLPAAQQPPGQRELAQVPGLPLRIVRLQNLFDRFNHLHAGECAIPHRQARTKRLCSTGAGQADSSS